MKTIKQIVALGSILSACNMPLISKEPAKASFPNDPLVAPVIENYEQQEMLFSNNKMFLWRDDMTASHVATAQLVARELDSLDEQAFPLSGKKFKLEKDIEPAQKVLRAAGARLNFIQTRTAKLAKDKDAELKKPEPSLDKIKKIEEEIATLEKEKPVREAEKFAAETEIKPVLEEIAKLDEYLLDIEKQGTRKVKEISEVVVWFPDQDLTTVSFRKDESGQMTVSISDWKLSENEPAKSFSTVDGTIRNLRYTCHGGVYEFEAVDKLTVYSFKVSRFRANDPFGRIIFTGNLERRQYGHDGTVKLTRGVAKFIDRKN